MFSFNYESVTLYEVGKAQHGVTKNIPPIARDLSSHTEKITDKAANEQTLSSSACESYDYTERDEIERVSKIMELK